MQRAEDGVLFGRIVEPPVQSPRHSGLGEPQKRHAHGLWCAEIEEVDGCEHPAGLFAADAGCNALLKGHGQNLIICVNKTS